MENMQEQYISLVSWMVASTTYAKKSIWQQVSANLISYPLSPAQAFKSYAAMWKKLLQKQESHVVCFSAMWNSEWAELAWDLEAVETGQCRAPCGPISTS